MGRTPAGQTRQRVLEFMRGRLLAGQPPTVREVQEALGFRAVQTARQHLERLVQEGKLLAAQGRSRGYRLPMEAEPTVLVPLLGNVAAGALREAIEHVEDFIAVQVRHGASKLFALRVEGESMTGAGILPGDVVIVRQQASAETGDTVVARVGDEATVKTLRLRRGRVELHPENPAFDPIVPDPKEVAILGKVVEVRRALE